MTHRPQRQKMPIEEFKRLYFEENLPNSQIAEYFGVTISSIQDIRKRYNLKPRGWSKPPWLGRSRSLETRRKISENRKGKTMNVCNPNWKGGKYVNCQGYVLVLYPGHLMANKQGYVLEHRLVMNQLLGRILSSNEVVHHRNGVKTDNRSENLELHTRSSHARHHFPQGSLFGIHHE